MTVENSVALRLLVQELGQMPAVIRTGLRVGFRKAGQGVLADARSNASWSSRIPGAMSLRTSTKANSAGVFIRVDARKAPHARPYEGVTGRNDSFRHPVFGNREVWVAQRTRPFLFPAAIKGRAAVVAAAESAVKAAFSGTSQVAMLRVGSSSRRISAA
jgi:hypothetical protein